MTNSKSGLTFWFAWLASLAFLLITTIGMPEMVAAKFDIHGGLGGWIPRTAYACSAVFLVLVLPMMVAEWPSMLVRKGSKWARVPHGEHWMKPENRGTAAGMLKSQLQEVGTMMIAYQAYRHWLIVEAHARQGRLLDVNAAMVSVVCLVVGVGLWVLMRYWMWTPIDKTTDES